MKTIAGSPLPAPKSPRIENLRLRDRPYRYSAYDMIIRAEGHAIQQEAEEDVMPPRIFGYLLLEFDAQPDIFSEGPCASIV